MNRAGKTFEYLFAIDVYLPHSAHKTAAPLHSGRRLLYTENPTLGVGFSEA